MAVGIGEVDAPSAVVVIDLTELALHRIGPVVEAVRSDAPEDLVELVLAHEEGVVLRLDRTLQRVW